MMPVPILHIMTRLPVGGVECQLLSVLRNYDRTKLAPLVCSLSDRGEIGREIEKEGIEVIALHRLGHRFSPSLVKDLYALIRKRNISIVRTHQYHANLYGRIAAALAGVPCIVASVHNIYTRDRKPHRRVLNRILSSFTDRIVAVSSSVMEDIIRFDDIPAGKVQVIHNGIDVPRFMKADGSPVRAELGIPADEVVVATVGRLAEQKGQKYLIEAASKLMEEVSFSVLIAGDGPLMDELKEQAARMGISGKVIFAGMRMDIPEILAASDIFVFPSLWEGLGNALLEAMAAGKPILATDIAPSREVIENEVNGILVPPEDAAALARSLERLLKDKELANNLGKAARDTVTSRFSIDVTVKSYIELFKHVLESKGMDIL